MFMKKLNIEFIVLGMVERYELEVLLVLVRIHTPGRIVKKRRRKRRNSQINTAVNMILLIPDWYLTLMKIVNQSPVDY